MAPRFTGDQFVRLVLSLDAFKKLSGEAEEHRMDLRLRAAVESYAKGSRGGDLKTVVGRQPKRAEKRRAAP